MGHKKQTLQQPTLASRHAASPARTLRALDTATKKRLEIVLKCDSDGTAEAVAAILARLRVADVDVKVIYSGVGPISKSDLLMAMTGEKLVIGFNVDVMPKLDQWIKEHGAEVRLYKVIYRLAEDVRQMAESLKARASAEERVMGKGRIIALFKSSHKGVILGCEVLEGVITHGRDFRIISAMGPIFTGRIESLQVEENRVKEARSGQQVGIKLSDFSQARIGDFVECFESTTPRKSVSWRPSGHILRVAD